VFLCDKTGNRHHVGMYRGGGVCAEAKGTRWGVVKSQITRWDEWGELKAVDYSAYPDAKERDPMNPTLRKGDRGEDVKRMQTLLNTFGHQLKVDGIFGSGTDKAVRSFQKSHRLTVDGICGPKTWAALTAKGQKKKDGPEIEMLEE
jgi:peptidoglycan hydrolase-like protein with peptidoglycan-binding domain